MRLVVLFLVVFMGSTLRAKSMSHQDAFNVVHNVLSQVSLNAAQHAQIEKALGMLKVLAGKKSAEIAKKVDKQRKDAVIKEYLDSLEKSEEKKDG